MTIQQESDRLAELIDADAELRHLASGYQFSEGPVWNDHEQALYYSDIPSDVRWRWSEASGAEEVLRPAFKGNGLVIDGGGALIACEQVTSAVSRFDRDGRRETIAFHHRGAYLNSPNDVVVRGRDGGIYFTDPDYGRWNDWIGIERARPLGYKGLYRVAAGARDGEAELLVDADEFAQPNGLCFSPDESLLYVNDSPRAHVKVFDVAEDGTLGPARIFIEGVGPGIGAGDEREAHHELHDSGALDGMKCDEDGNLWATGPGGVWVISPEGERLGIVRSPEVVGNLAWGGPDLRSLFLTTSTTLHVVETKVRGAQLPHLTREREVTAG